MSELVGYDVHDLSRAKELAECPPVGITFGGVDLDLAREACPIYGPPSPIEDNVDKPLQAFAVYWDRGAKEFKVYSPLVYAWNGSRLIEVPVEVRKFESQDVEGRVKLKGNIYCATQMYYDDKGAIKARAYVYMAGLGWTPPEPSGKGYLKESLLIASKNSYGWVPFMQIHLGVVVIRGDKAGSFPSSSSSSSSSSSEEECPYCTDVGAGVTICGYGYNFVKWSGDTVILEDVTWACRLEVDPVVYPNAWDIVWENYVVHIPEAGDYTVLADASGATLRMTLDNGYQTFVGEGVVRSNERTSCPLYFYGLPAGEFDMRLGIGNYEAAASTGGVKLTFIRGIGSSSSSSSSSSESWTYDSSESSSSSRWWPAPSESSMSGSYTPCSECDTYAAEYQGPWSADPSDRDDMFLAMCDFPCEYDGDSKWVRGTLRFRVYYLNQFTIKPWAGEISKSYVTKEIEDTTRD